MYKDPVGQYANYIDEGMERANDSQSVKCFYCLQARADPLPHLPPPLMTLRPKVTSPGVRGHCHAAGQKGVAMVTALAEQRPGVARRGVTVDVRSADVMLLDLFKLHSEAAGGHFSRRGCGLSNQIQ